MTETDAELVEKLKIEDGFVEKKVGVQLDILWWVMDSLGYFHHTDLCSVEKRKLLQKNNRLNKCFWQTIGKYYT